MVGFCYSVRVGIAPISKTTAVKGLFSENDNACPKEHPVPYSNGGYCCKLISGIPDEIMGISQNDLCNLLTYLLSTNNTEETCIDCPHISGFCTHNEMLLNVEALYNCTSYADDLTFLYEGVELNLGITEVNISENRPPFVAERLF